ncbi:Rho guanine nucleotide exchange factor 5 [Manis javanica]|nr:Rho guanine nucleotide exchange factor 5 [Manis javanica]
MSRKDVLLRTEEARRDTALAVGESQKTAEAGYGTKKAPPRGSVPSACMPRALLVSHNLSRWIVMRLNDIRDLSYFLLERLEKVPWKPTGAPSYLRSRRYGASLGDPLRRRVPDTRESGCVLLPGGRGYMLEKADTFRVQPREEMMACIFKPNAS